MSYTIDCEDQTAISGYITWDWEYYDGFKLYTTECDQTIIDF